MDKPIAMHVELSLLDEQELILRTQKGDSEAFNPIVSKYRQKIYNLIYSRVSDREAAEDICQEVFLKAWKALPKFRGDSALYSWIYKIAINCIIDFYRKENKHYVMSLDEYPKYSDDVLHTVDNCTFQTHLLENKELEDIIGQAVSRLPTGQRRVFHLRYDEELPIKDIASRLNRSEGTIKTHLHHAHRKLRNMLLPYLHNEHIGWLITS